MSDELKQLLVEWGNYLLSDERKNSIENKEVLNQVGDWDLENFIDKHPERFNFIAK